MDPTLPDLLAPPLTPPPRPAPRTGREGAEFFGPAARRAGHAQAVRAALEPPAARAFDRAEVDPQCLGGPRDPQW